MPTAVASAQPFSHSRAFVVLLLLAATVVATALIAGGDTPLVLAGWRNLIVPLIFLAPPTMCGLLLTSPAQRAGVFDGSPWPAAFRVIVGAALGCGALAIVTLLAGLCHLLDPPWISVVVLGAFALAGAGETRRLMGDRRAFNALRRASRPVLFLALLAAIPLATLLIAATFPPGTLWRSELRGFDVMEYHLEVPREYAAANSAVPLPHNVYSLFPANVEMLYLLQTQFARTLTGSDSYLAGVLPAQFLHALLMLLTAAALALAPWPGGGGGRFRAGARIAAALLFLAIPWVLVTGSLAYNEGGMMLAGSLALLLALAPAPTAGARRQGIVLIGVLLGIAAGCKLTAAVFFGLPIVLILLWTTRSLGGVVGMALLGAAAYSPWAVRAAIHSGGNPLFPIASTVLPRDSWTAAMAERFAAGHSAPPGERSVRARLGALAREGLFDQQWSPGVASAAEWSAALQKRPLPEIGESPAWERVGPLWPLAALAIFVALLRPRERAGRRTALLLLGAMVIQLLLWLAFTHLQARFLLPLATPLALLVGCGFDTPVAWERVVGGALLALQAVSTGLLLLPEAGLLLGENAAANTPAAERPSLVIGDVVHWQINLDAYVARVPPGYVVDRSHPGKALLVGTSTALQLANPAVYATVFDENPLGDALRRGGPGYAVAWMQSQKIRWVWIDTQEIARLRKTYGFDASIGEDIAQRLESAGCRRLALDLPRNVTLLAVPPAAAASLPATR
ncbi:MAG TPA: hypothetical protein VHQ47_13385 [Phycisphaerae bacterium]|nr:hypothetical protein [Phycisphaerae bacterium]